MNKHPMVKAVVGDVLQVIFYAKIESMRSGESMMDSINKVLATDKVGIIAMRYAGILYFHNVLTDTMLEEYITEIVERAKPQMEEIIKHLEPGESVSPGLGRKLIFEAIRVAAAAYEQQLKSDGFDPKLQPVIGSGNYEALAEIRRVLNGS